MVAESVKAGHIWRVGGIEFQIVAFVGAGTLKLRAPNEAWTYEMESKLVCDNLRERVE